MSVVSPVSVRLLTLWSFISLGFKFLLTFFSMGHSPLDRFGTAPAELGGIVPQLPAPCGLREFSMLLCVSRYMAEGNFRRNAGAPDNSDRIFPFFPVVFRSYISPRSHTAIHDVRAVRARSSNTDRNVFT